MALAFWTLLDTILSIKEIQGIYEINLKKKLIKLMENLKTNLEYVQ